MPKMIKPETPEFPPKGFPLLTATNGKGFWSHAIRDVKITALKVDYIAAESKFASLNAYFDPTTWGTDQNGLIYTDPEWINSFRDALVEQLDVPRDVVESIGYSEQGLQGDTYVNLDCGAAFYDFLNSDKADSLGPPPTPKMLIVPTKPIKELKVVLIEFVDRQHVIRYSIKFPKKSPSEAIEYVEHEVGYGYKYGTVWYEDGTHQRYTFETGQLEDFDTEGKPINFE